MRYTIALFIVICSIFSCKKGEEAVSDIPAIEFISVSPQSATQYSDSLTFVIGYEDGDGDLGSNDPDTRNLFLTDSRNNVTYEFRVKQLSPTGSTISIKGNLSVVLDNVGLINGSTTETTVYSIYVVDEAGNRSNTVKSDVVTINP
jgi:hypothetical protein